MEKHVNTVENRAKWTPENTTCLLSLVEMCLAVKKNEKRNISFKVIHKQMKVKGYNFSRPQLRNKWKKLKESYIEHTRRISNGGDEGEAVLGMWPYYDIMHRLMTSQPHRQIAIVAPGLSNLKEDTSDSDVLENEFLIQNISGMSTISGMPTQGNMVTCGPSSSSNTTTDVVTCGIIPSTITLQGRPDKTQTFQDEMEEEISSLMNTTTTTTPSSIDAHQLFFLSVAQETKNWSDLDKAKLKLEIRKLILSIQFGQ
ncbi:uncharacterized protein LOC144742469 [Ciona intestinalis]